MAMKRILKALFPRMVLKNLFLRYNKIKNRTWDAILYKEHIVPKEFFVDYQAKNPFLELNIDTHAFGKEIHDKFSLWNDPRWTQDQYLLHYRLAGFIDPETGWGVSENKELIYPSLGFARAAHVHKPNFFHLFFSMKKVVRLKRIISLRDTGEENYFHFYNDVLAKIFYLRDHKIDFSKFTIVVSERLHSKAYFQYFLSTPFLASLHWHVQSHEWIHFEEAIFCKPFTHTKKYLDEMLHSVKSEIVGGGVKRIFLTRSSKSFRFVENIDQLKPILYKYNFEIVDTSSLSMQDQIALFNECRYLVAVHGAGITNVVYRKGQELSLLEIIQPSSYIPFHYGLLCKMYNYSYDVILGDKGRESGNGGFRIDPFFLESKLKEMI
jgi:hypothetical protein